MTTVLKKNFQFFHKLKLVDLLTIMTCNNDNFEIYETQLVDMLTKLTWQKSQRKKFDPINWKKEIC